MKRPTLLTVIGLAALLCTLAMVVNATDSCLVNVWAGPMGPEDMQGHVQVTFYTMHSWPDCYCEHEAGDIYLIWRYVGDDWSSPLLMNTLGIDLCELVYYDKSFTVNHGSTIDVYVWDEDYPEVCHFGVPAWRVP